MRNRISALWDTLQSSYWFIPMLMAAAAFLLFLLTINIDLRVPDEFLRSIDWIYRNAPDGARSVLSTIASSMITVAGLAFSLTMVVLTLTSQQYGPLVLGNFMRDRANQFVLGTFTATFIYCLLVMRTIRSVEEGFFVPHISTFIGFLLSLGSVTVLIYFIHHVSASIQSTAILSRIGDSLHDTIDDLFPESIGEGADRLHIDKPHETIPSNFDEQSLALRARDSGYIAYIDTDALLAAAKAHDIILELKYRPGNFLTARSTLGRIYPLERVTTELEDAILDAFILGDRRTQAQDVEFLIDQIVSIAVRSMSAAINDPFTSVMALDRLIEGLCRLGERPSPSPFRYDDGQRLRVITNPVTFKEVFYRAFDEIRRYGSSDLKVALHLLTAIEILGECIRPENRRILPAYAEVIWHQCREQLTEEIDRSRLDVCFEETINALKANEHAA